MSRFSIINILCKECKQQQVDLDWCNPCNAIHFIQDFEKWTSGNSDLDEFIKGTQIPANSRYDVLEWIPYDRFDNVKYVSNGEYGKMYKANFIDGYIVNWNIENQNWDRRNPNMIVALKSLNNSQNDIMEVINQIISILDIEPSLFNSLKSVYGITQDPETNNYMIVLDSSLVCEGCNQQYNGWCNYCMAKHFEQNFEKWTSDNVNIDKLIQNVQLTARNYRKILEWIPYDRFYDIKYIAKGGFGEVYRANWIDGFINRWDYENQNWKRDEPNKQVALKSLTNSQNVTFEFFNEITMHHKLDNFGIVVELYGITQDPVTKDYMMVLDYMENGSLRSILDKNYNKLNWKDRIQYLYGTAAGIHHIHTKEIIHRNLHIGNILEGRMKQLNLHVSYIADMGLCRPADSNDDDVFGVLPYMAPEVLRERNYTKASDIYSFGIIMYEIISGLPPYHDVSHDECLAIEICNGLRPKFNIEVPQLIVDLIKRCLNADPLERPTSKEVNDDLYILNGQIAFHYEDAEIIKQIKKAEQINVTQRIAKLRKQVRNGEDTSRYKIHPEASYTSKLHNYSNLPQPKNSDDYYE